jgi:hypothetical protein
MFRRKLIVCNLFDQVVANVTECDFSSSEVLVKCIKELTEEQIINATKKVGAENLK